MKTVTGLFDTYRQAEDAVAALKESGISGDDISIVSRDPEYVDDTPESSAVDGAGVGSGLGLVAGGGAGLLTGLGMMAIPGVGPVVAAGWLVATLAGAAAGTVVGGAAGGLIGALTGSDVPEQDAHVYAESVRRGGTVVSARVHDDRVLDAQAILDRHTPVDIEGRRKTYAESGWERFNEDLPPYTAATPSITPTDISKLDEERYGNRAGTV
ncbi:MAG: hypothetical protein JWM58_4462 [Rhizobium sp.]|nr:hypothetical protein [Rhizobium sp.]